MAGSAALLWAVISLLCYGLLLSGILYDVIVAPPSSGLFVDVAGKQRSLPMRSDLESAQGKCAAKDLLHFPDRVHAHTHTHNSMGKQNLNKQYIIEGLSAGFLVVVGSMGCILLTVCAIKV